MHVNLQKPCKNLVPEEDLHGGVYDRILQGILARLASAKLPEAKLFFAISG